MKASKFTDAQKAFILKQGEDGVPVAEICRKAGISQATYFNWKNKYAGMLPPEMKRLKLLEDENGRLKRIVADPNYYFAYATYGTLVWSTGRPIEGEKLYAKALALNPDDANSWSRPVAWCKSGGALVNSGRDWPGVMRPRLAA